MYSTDESPVKYNAFDKDLQMWVAACLYKGTVDVYRIFVGEMDDETADRHYAEGMNLCTTLQVPPEMWPADRAAFDEYWQESLDKVHIDDTMREYLYPIAVEPGRAGSSCPRRSRQASDELHPADHDGISAAAVPRRDAVAVGPRSTSGASTG